MRTQATAAISKAQIKAIHVAVQRRGLDEETYRRMLAAYGVTTSRDLSRAEASQLLDRLNGRAASAVSARPITARRRHTWRPARRPLGPDPEITPKQQGYLNALFTRLGWDQIRRDAFCQRVIGTPWPQTNSQVTALLQILRPLVARYPTGYERTTSSDMKGDA